MSERLLIFADFASKAIDISGGKGVEANPFWLVLGGHDCDALP